MKPINAIFESACGYTVDSKRVSIKMVVFLDIKREDAKKYILRKKKLTAEEIIELINNRI